MDDMRDAQMTGPGNCAACTMPDPVKEVVPPSQPLEATDPNVPQPPKKSEAADHAGYKIVVKTDGTFEVTPIGDNVTIIDLLGLHQLAGNWIEAQVQLRQRGHMQLILDGIEYTNNRLDTLIGSMTRPPRK